MTTWKEAINAFRLDKEQAEAFKQNRDAILWSVLAKIPGDSDTGNELLKKEIYEHNVNIRNTEIIHN